jgi:hypothetical protein
MAATLSTTEFWSDRIYVPHTKTSVVEYLEKYELKMVGIGNTAINLRTLSAKYKYRKEFALQLTDNITFQDNDNEI